MPNVPTSQQLGSREPPRGISPPGVLPIGHSRNNSNGAANPYSTLPTAASSTAKLPADELGYGAGYGIKPPYATHQPTKSNTLNDEFPPVRPTPTINTNLKPITPPPAAVPAATPVATTNGATTGVGRRPRSAGGPGGGNRFTIMNAHPTEISGDRAPATNKNWLSAEEEKAQLFEKARARVELTQGAHAAPVSCYCTDGNLISFIDICVSASRICISTSCISDVASPGRSRTDRQSCQLSFS